MRVVADHRLTVRRRLGKAPETFPSALATTWLHVTEDTGQAERMISDVLAPMLSSAFDDDAINEEEMTLLAETISSVESEWLTQNRIGKAAPAPEPRRISA